MPRFAPTLPTFVLVIVCGCSDATLPHREKLALCFVEELAPLDVDWDAIPPAIHRMYAGAESAKRSARLFEAFLADSPPLDAQLIELVERYVANERQRGQQFATAVAEGRTDLTEAEGAIAAECSRQNFFLGDEICRRIDFDSIVTVSN